MKKVFLVLSFFIIFYSCSSSDDNNGGGDVKDQVLTGTVEGKPFTYKGGQAFYTTLGDEELISINLTNESADCSSDIFNFGLRISAWVPRNVGVFSDITIVTQDGNNTPFNHLGETVEITALSDTEVSGKIKLNDPASGIFPENIFEGTFTMPLCE